MIINHQKFKKLFHIDCYQISPMEGLEMTFKIAAEDESGVHEFFDLLKEAGFEFNITTLEEIVRH